MARLLTYGYEIRFKIETHKEAKRVYREIEAFEKKLNQRLRKERSYERHFVAPLIGLIKKKRS